MSWRLTVSMTLTPLVLIACGSNDIEGTSRTGIYELEVVREADTCTPTRAVGNFGQVSVIAEPEGYAIPFAVVGKDDPVLGMSVVNVGWGAPFNRKGDVLGCPGTVETESLELLSDRNPIEIRYAVRYTGVAPCEPNPDVRYITLPDSDCTASLRLRYSLLQVCEEPCVMQYNFLSHTFRCECA